MRTTAIRTLHVPLIQKISGECLMTAETLYNAYTSECTKSYKKFLTVYFVIIDEKFYEMFLTVYRNHQQNLMKIFSQCITIEVQI